MTQQHGMRVPVPMCRQSTDNRYRMLSKVGASVLNGRDHLKQTGLHTTGSASTPNQADIYIDAIQ